MSGVGEALCPRGGVTRGGSHTKKCERARGDSILFSRKRDVLTVWVNGADVELSKGDRVRIPSKLRLGIGVIEEVLLTSERILEVGMAFQPEDDFRGLSWALRNDIEVLKTGDRVHGQKPSEMMDEKLEEKKMEKKMEKKTQSTSSMLSDHLVRGGKVAIADEAGDITLDIARKMLGETWPEVFNTESGRMFAKLVAAMTLHYGAEKFPDMVPGAENIQAACGYVVEAQARDLIQPRLSTLRPALTRLATVGKSVAAGAVRLEVPEEEVPTKVSRARRASA